MKLKINLSIATQHSNNKMQKSKIKLKQDGPSLESSSYLNVSLRYLDPWDPWTFGPLDPGPSDSWTSSLLHPLTSSYLFLLLYPLVQFGMVWYVYVGGGCVMILEIEIGSGPLTFIVIVDVGKFWGYSSQLIHPPPKPPPTFS